MLFFNRTQSKITPAIAFKLKNLPPKIELTAIALVLLSVPYAVFAFKLFPNGDCYNGYAYGYYYIISSLLNGVIPYWDPMAACGSPCYLSFLSGGLFEPLFAVSVLIGKILSFNVLQTYMVWIILRNFPIFIGMFWLLKQSCRHSTIAIFGAAFVYYTISICLLRDGIPFVVYWPLLLATLTYFAGSLRRGRPSLSAFYGSILLFCISLLIHNPAFTLVFTGIVGIGILLTSWRQAIGGWRLFLKHIKLAHRVLSVLMVIVLLSPAAVLFINYRNSDNFAYVRVHQAKRNTGRTLSNFSNEPLDYVEAGVEKGPMRMGREFSTCLFPFFYRLNWFADGTVYFGFLGCLGVLMGLLFGRRKTFFLYLLAAIMVAFLMTWSANGVIVFAQSFLPFLKMLNQRQLLYPAFLIFATVAGCVGFRALLNYRLLRKIAVHFTFSRIFITGFTLLTATAVFVVFASVQFPDYLSLFDFKAVRLYVLFILALLGILFLARKSIERPRLFGVYLFFLAFIYLADASFYFANLTADRDRNTGMLARSRILRDRLTLSYCPFRSPLLPCAYGGTHTDSIVHQLNLRSALPAYWNCDIMFSSYRYYDLISFLTTDKLKSLLSISAPMVKLYSRSTAIADNDDAIVRLLKMNQAELQDLVVLEESDRRPADALDVVLQRISAGSPMPQRIMPSVGLNSSENEGSLHVRLFDSVVTLPGEAPEEAAHGIYHDRAFFSKFPPHSNMVFSDPGDLMSRYFFPDFPFATDINGVMYYISKDYSTLMKFVSGEGLLLESNRSRVTVPAKMYVIGQRLPVPENPKVFSYGPNRIGILTQTESPAVLYYGDLYDVNWRATIDGKPADVLIANHAFKAVRVPAGRHAVVFKYEVPYFALTVIAYFLCILLFCIMAGAYFLRKRQYRIVPR